MILDEELGGIQGDERLVTAGQLCREGILFLQDGNHGEYRPRPNEFCDEGVAFIRAGDMEAGGIGFDSASKINDVALARIRKGIGKPLDILLSHKGTVGRMAVATADSPQFVCSPQVTIWRTLDEDSLDRSYLYYFMQSAEFIEQLERVKGQTDMADYASLTDQRSFLLRLPQIDEQRRIGRVLGSLDEKIKVNSQMNKTLEELARATFKAWFIDFLPIRAKQDGMVTFTGMDAHTLALFPDSLEESPLGAMPAGWRISTVGDEFDLTMGQSPPGSTYNVVGEGVPFFQGRTDFGSRYPTNRVYCSEPTRFANAGDTLVSVRAPVGDVNMAMERCCIGRGIAASRHKSGSRLLTYLAMKELSVEFEQFEGAGTVFGSIGGKEFRQLPALSLPDAVVEAFDRVTKHLDDLIESNTIESAALCSTRDLLLRRLIREIDA